MPSFDYFSQPQGVTIPISIFGQAESQGIAAGNAQKSPGQAIAEGIQGGIKNYLDTNQAFQEQEIKQNQIDMLPVTNELTRQQVESYKLKNQATNLEIQDYIQNQDEQHDYTKEKLTDATEKLQEERNLRQKRNQLLESWSTSDPLTNKQALFSGQYNDIFSKDLNLFRQLGSSVMPYMSPGEQKAFNVAISKGAIQNQYAADSPQHQYAAQVAQQELYQNDDFQKLVSKTGLSPAITAKKVRLEPSGKYAVDENGNMIMTSNGPKLSDLYDPSVKTSDAFIDNKLVLPGIDKKLETSLHKHKVAQSLVSGAYLQQDLNNVDVETYGKPSPKVPASTSLGGAQSAPLTEAQKKTVQAKGTSITPSTASIVQAVPIKNEAGINLSENPLMYDALRESLKIPPAKFVSVKPAFQKLFSVLEAPVSGNFGYSVDQRRDLSGAKERIVKSLAQIDFDSNPKIKETYNDAAVAAHNERVRQFKDMMVKAYTFEPGGIGDLLSQEDPADIQTLIPVNSPEELFRVKNANKYASYLDALIENLHSKIKGAKAAKLNGMSFSSDIAALGGM